MSITSISNAITVSRPLSKCEDLYNETSILLQLPIGPPGPIGKTGAKGVSVKVRKCSYGFNYRVRNEVVNMLAVYHLKVQVHLWARK